jgi:hypothetical protein
MTPSAMEPPLPRRSKRCVRIQLITAPMREKMDGGGFWSRSAKTFEAYTCWRSFSACCESMWHTDPWGSASVCTSRSRRCLPPAMSGGVALRLATIGERSAPDDGASASACVRSVSAAAGCAGTALNALSAPPMSMRYWSVTQVDAAWTGDAEATPAVSAAPTKNAASRRLTVTARASRYRSLLSEYGCRSRATSRRYT